MKSSGPETRKPQRPSALKALIQHNVGFPKIQTALDLVHVKVRLFWCERSASGGVWLQWVRISGVQGFRSSGL
eukprot:3071604-Alexandrium_andersonii.AAC.1